MASFRKKKRRRFLDDLDPDAPGTTVLEEGARLAGKIVAPGDVVIAGALEGDLESGGRVLVARGGTVRGAVRAGDAKIEGEVEGPIEASGRVEVGCEASLRGGLRASRLDVAEGAEILGEVSTASPSNRFTEQRR